MRNSNPYKIIIFGSYARGTASQHSDIDIMVLVEDSDLRSTKRATEAYRSLREIRYSKDILVRTRKEIEAAIQVPASIEAQVIQTGKVIYG